MAQFKVYYNPNPFPVPGEHELGEFDHKDEAVSAAIEYSKTYYGQCSPIWVMDGRKKIYTAGQ